MERDCKKISNGGMLHSLLLCRAALWTSCKRQQHISSLSQNTGRNARLAQTDLGTYITFSRCLQSEDAVKMPIKNGMWWEFTLVNRKMAHSMHIHIKLHKKNCSKDFARIVNCINKQPSFLNQLHCSLPSIICFVSSLPLEASKTWSWFLQPHICKPFLLVLLPLWFSPPTSLPTHEHLKCNFIFSAIVL